MNKTLFILNHPPYGTEYSFNALRLAEALLRRSEQKAPSGYYTLELMLKTLLRHQGEAPLCGTCIDARSMRDAEMLVGTKRSNLDELTDWTLWADKVIPY